MAFQGIRDMLAGEDFNKGILCRCRQVTASLPDMAALQAAIRGQPRPAQPDAERVWSRLLPDVAVAERAHTLQSLQAAAEQVCPPHPVLLSSLWYAHT